MNHKNPYAYNQEAAGMVAVLTNTDVVLAEERVHFVDICHELAVTKSEISHISTRLSSCQHLEQSWRKTSLGSHSVTKCAFIP